MPSSPSDQSLITQIKLGGQAREQAVQHLIQQHIGYISTLIRKLGVGTEEAQDAYTDSVITLMDHIEQDTFQGKSKLSTYLYRIFFNKCVDLARKKTTNKGLAKFTHEIPNQPDRARDILHLLGVQEQVESLDKLMDRIGAKCKQILMDWGFWGYTMGEIAERNGLKHANSAKKQKYKCLQKLLELVPVIKPNADTFR